MQNNENHATASFFSTPPPLPQPYRWSDVREDKDAFERYYKNHTAKRLLLDRVRSDDLEKRVLESLKVVDPPPSLSLSQRRQLECGMQFTSKLESMYNDLRLSADAGSRFKTSEHVPPLPPRSF